MIDARSVHKLIDRALDGIGDEPIAEQIAINDAAAHILFEIDRPASDMAQHTVDLLREAERHQLKFRELLRS